MSEVEKILVIVGASAFIGFIVLVILGGITDKGLKRKDHNNDVDDYYDH